MGVSGPVRAPAEHPAVASPQSLRRIARLAHTLEKDLKEGGMAYPWKALFRTNSMLTRIVAHLAEHLASQAEAQSAAGGAGRAQLPRRTRVTLDVERER